MMMGMGSALSMILAMAVWVVGWLVVVAAVVALVWWAARGWGSPRSDTALAILRERYARGEISREEFEERRRDLAA